MTKEELLQLIVAVRTDMAEASDSIADPFSMALLFAEWHLSGQPSFKERREELKRKFP